jgi:alanine racemase
MVEAITRPTRLLISQQAVSHNIAAVRKMSGAKTVFQAVKANAYGFGLIPFSQAAIAAGVDGLAVAVLDEALALRDAGITVPILILGIVLPQYAGLIADNDIIATVSSVDWLAAAQPVLTESKPLKVSLAVDTGMGRIGFRERGELEAAITALHADPADFIYHGLMTHFSEGDSLKVDYFHKQLTKWHEMTQGLEMPPMVHLANSGATMYHGDEVPMDVVRIGTVTYGIEPSLGEVIPDDYLKPVMTLESELIFVKQMHEGDGISYGHIYYAGEGEWIGTVPVGYGDGLTRDLTGYKVLVNGVEAPIVGKLAMDQLMVSLPGPLPVGTKVTFLGRNGDREKTLDDMAAHTGMAPWEITTALQDRLHRLVVD